MSVKVSALMKRGLFALSAIAMTEVGGTPAPARDRHGYDGPDHAYGYRHHRYRDRLDSGDAIGIVALVGAVALIASTASKNRTDGRYPENRAPNRRCEGGAEDYYGVPVDEDDAVNACVAAARDKTEAERGGYAEILDVDRPHTSGEGKWDVAGRIEHRRNFQDRSGVTRRFTCNMRAGRVADVAIFDDRA